MSEFLHLSCPDVKYWCFPSFSKDFQNIKNIWSFLWPRTCKKMTIVANLTLLHILPPNESICKFSCPWYFPSFSKPPSPPPPPQKKKKNKKKKYSWSLRWPWTCKNWQILLISHFCVFSPQMSEFLHFSCPDVKYWCFHSFSKTFKKKKKKKKKKIKKKKNKKIEVLYGRGPA